MNAKPQFMNPFLHEWEAYYQDLASDKQVMICSRGLSVDRKGFDRRRQVIIERLSEGTGAQFGGGGASHFREGE